MIAPSQRLDDIAADHQNELPVPVRADAAAWRHRQGPRCARSGAGELPAVRGADTRALLMALGEADAMARRDEVVAFFGWTARKSDAAVTEPPSLVH